MKRREIGARLITDKEAAAYCGVSVPTFFKLIRPFLSIYRLGPRTVRYDKFQLERTLNKLSGVPKLDAEYIEKAYYEDMIEAHYERKEITLKQFQIYESWYKNTWWWRTYRKGPVIDPSRWIPGEDGFQPDPPDHPLPKPRRSRRRMRGFPHR